LLFCKKGLLLEAFFIGEDLEKQKLLGLGRGSRKKRENLIRKKKPEGMTLQVFFIKNMIIEAYYEAVPSVGLLAFAFGAFNQVAALFVRSLIKVAAFLATR